MYKKSFLMDEWFVGILPLTKKEFDRRFDTIFHELECLDLGYYTILETGCIRSLDQYDWQGQFTIIADHFVNYYDGEVLTCNISLDAVNICKDFTKVKAYCQDSIEFLGNIKNIDEVNLFYLDSLDIDRNNPQPSITHHFNEFSIIIHKRTLGEFFLCIDDNVTPEVSKGFEIKRLLLKLSIPSIFDSYQTLYWISNDNFIKIKNSM